MRQEIYECIQSPYWGFRYFFVYSAAANRNTMHGPDYLTAYSNNQFYWSINIEDLFGDTTEYQSLMESWSSNISYLGVSTSQFTDCLDVFRHSTFGVLDVSSTSPYYYYYSNNFGAVSSDSTVLSSFCCRACCDLAITLSTFQNVSDFVPLDSFSTRESQALGFDGTSMVVYLCNNSCTLLDEFGIKVDPLFSTSVYRLSF